MGWTIDPDGDGWAWWVTLGNRPTYLAEERVVQAGWENDRVDAERAARTAAAGWIAAQERGHRA